MALAKKGEDHVVLGEKRREREDHTALVERLEITMRFLAEKKGEDHAALAEWRPHG